ncbi:MAG: hypothetical protein GC185_02160 [Alphaproteobacteria bacterium]|nr:hypothetical protein [Alphaproteobacteria bacterium]
MSPLYQSLSFNAAKKGVDAAVSLIDRTISDSKTDIATLGVMSSWLIDNTYGQVDDSKINAVYFLKLYDVEYARAQMVKQMRGGGGQATQYRQATLDAFKALLTYELMAMADARRCSDDSVVGVVAQNLLPRYKDIDYAYTYLNRNEVKLAWYSAMQVEAQKSDRPFNLQLCLQGERALSDPSRYNPRDVTTSQWTDIRSELRSKYTDYWKGRYAEALRNKHNHH